MEMLGHNGFAIQREYKNSKESLAITYTSSFYKIPYKITNDILENHIPIGSVEWTSKYLGRNVIPNYYPDFLKEHLHRKVWKTDKWPLGLKVFVKSADKDKRFKAFVTNGGYKGKKKGTYWCSEVVSFGNEWRYYVADGKVLTGEWYDGDEINTPEAPPLNITFPDDFCGAVDMGMVEDKLTLVEVNNPFACGWYGKNHNLYTKWIISGWKYVENLVKNSSK